MNASGSNLSTLLELARKVKTKEGVKKYGEPIGSVISDEKDAPTPKRAVTLERLKSLQRQLQTARKTGNTALLKDAEREFLTSLREYAVDKPPSQVLTELQDTGAHNTKTRLGEKLDD